MATNEQIQRALIEDDAFRRRILMNPKDRNPDFDLAVGCDGSVEDFVNQMSEEEIEESKKLLTPAALT